MVDVTVAGVKRATADHRASMDEVFALLYNDVHREARARLARNWLITLLDEVLRGDLLFALCRGIATAGRLTGRSRCWIGWPARPRQASMNLT